MKIRVLLMVITVHFYTIGLAQQSFINYIQGYWRIGTENSERYNLYIGKYVFDIGSKPVIPSQDLILDYDKYSVRVGFAREKLLDRLERASFSISFEYDSIVIETEIADDITINSKSYEPIFMIEYKRVKNQSDTIYRFSELWQIYQPKDSSSFTFEINNKPYPIKCTRITDPPQFVKDFEKKMRSIIFRKIIAAKASIYKDPNNPTKMYLEQGDEVETLETQPDWVKIRYYGKRIIEGWIKKEDVESVASSSTASAALPTKTARLLALEAACKSSGLTLVLAQTQEGTTFLINKGDKPLNYFIVQLPSRKQTLGFLTESLRGVEQHFIDDVEAGKVKFNAVLDANGKPVKDRQGFVLNYLTLPSGREAWAFVKQN